MTYTITVTEDQARVLSVACEVLARLGIGQFRDALEHLPTRTYLPGWSEDMTEIGRMLSTYMIHSVDGWQSSLGIHHEAVKAESKTAWDLHQTIRHRLAWDKAMADGIIKPGEPRNWQAMFGVQYDEPLKSSKEPLATIIKTGN